jgi:hypothetical protein
LLKCVKWCISIGTENNIDFETYVRIDEDLMYEDENLDINVDALESQEESDSDDDVIVEQDNSDNCMKTNKEALLYLQKIKAFTSKSGDIKGFELSVNLEEHFENLIYTKKTLCQTTMLDFFHPSSSF